MTYEVWYEPYGLRGEEDFIVVTALNETMARIKGSTYGYVASVKKVTK